MQLNTAQKCVKRMQPAASRIIRPLFNLGSAKFTRSSMPTFSHTEYHIISYLQSADIEVRKKTAENADSHGFGSNLSGAAFCMPNNWWTSCPMKIRLYKSLALSILLYGCESWTLTAHLERRIQAFENKCCLRMLGVGLSLGEHETNGIRPL